MRLAVANEFRREDTVFPKVVEGRLITDLADMETFRMVGPDRPGDFLLNCIIRNLNIGSGRGYLGDVRDAEHDGRMTLTETVTADMTLDLILLDGQGDRIHEGKLSVSATREVEVSAERTVSLITEELVDRAAQKIERLLRKKLRRL